MLLDEKTKRELAQRIKEQWQEATNDHLYDTNRLMTLEGRNLQLQLRMQVKWRILGVPGTL